MEWRWKMRKPHGALVRPAPLQRGGVARKQGGSKVMRAGVERGEVRWDGAGVESWLETICCYAEVDFPSHVAISDESNQLPACPA